MRKKSVPKVSVVMPVYQAEKYLEESLESVLRQTVRDFELICVNDGSTDGSEKILRKYAKKDARIKVIKQTNKGVSAARNAGFCAARGEYVYCMDSDDMLAENALEMLCKKADATGAEIVYFSADVKLETQLPPHMKNYSLHRTHAYPDGLSGVDMMLRMMENGEYKVSTCLQFFRRSFLTEHKLEFCEDMSRCEDNVFALAAGAAAHSTACIPDQLYIRRVRADSLVTAKQSFENAWCNFLAGLRVNRMVTEHLGREEDRVYVFGRQRFLLDRAKDAFALLDEEEKSRLNDKPEHMQALFRLITQIPSRELNEEQYRKQLTDLMQQEASVPEKTSLLRRVFKKAK